MGNPFFIQQTGFGNVRTSRSLVALDEGIGGDFGATNDERQFLGSTIPARRFWLGAAGFILAVGLLIARAAQLQLVRGDHYASLAESNRTRSYVVVPPRGIVYDRFETALVQNVPAFVFSLTYANLPKDPVEQGRVIDRAADLVGIPRAEIDLLLSDARKSAYDAFPVRKGIPYEAAMRLAIEEASVPGFALETSTIRAYPTSSLSLSHLLGYVGKINPEEHADKKASGYRAVDEIGKSGLERTQETALRGTPGMLSVEVDARGRELSVDGKTDPIAGQSLTLAIDLPLQKFVETRLSEVLQRLDLPKGVVVAIDPRSGSVRAMVSLPAFDSNAFSNGIDAEAYKRLIEDENRPLFSRAVAGEYPPGSTFKPYVAYAALAEGLVGAHTSFVSTGGVRVGEWYFPDWKAGGHGITDVRKALAWSVNTYFYVIGGGFAEQTGLGVERIGTNAALFGFGSRTGIALPGEADGFLPSKEWKLEAKGERWYVGDTYHLAIGQGDMLATPLQVAVATAAIGNGGTRYVPRLVEAIGDDPVAPEPIDVTLDPEAVQVVREGMRGAVTYGSARFLNSLALPVAGKTGTAQASVDKPTHAWFEGFGPYDDPTLAVVVLVENGGEGSAVAVPIARDIFEWWFANRQASE